MLGKKHNVVISFAPKITVGKAGSGLHIHMMLEKDDTNYIADEVGLTDIAKKFIAGVLEHAESLTAFGNTIPTSYLRLVPHQEAPTMVCWGDSNRSVLVRVPLGWIAKTNMIKDANPQERGDIPYIPGKQTVELRSPDGSADLYHLMAGIILAAKDGILAENSLEKANKTYVNFNIFDDKHKDIFNTLKRLPTSCYESAECLEKDREFYEKDGVFPKGTINGFVKRLKDFDDKDMNERLFNNHVEIKKLVDNYIHCM
jgi:glutamine synthetase